MNIGLIIGKIVRDIEFKFIINNKKYYSISILKVELDNKSIVTVKAYNDIADWCYKNLLKNDNVAIYGNLNSKMEIVVEEIEII